MKNQFSAIGLLGATMGTACSLAVASKVSEYFFQTPESLKKSIEKTFGNKIRNRARHVVDKNGAYDPVRAI